MKFAWNRGKKVICRTRRSPGGIPEVQNLVPLSGQPESVVAGVTADQSQVGAGPGALGLDHRVSSRGVPRYRGIDSSSSIRKEDPTLTHASGVPPRATPDVPPSAAVMLGLRV